MGAMGSDAAIEAADVVLMNDSLSRLPDAVRLSRKTMRIAWQNIVLSLLVKAAVLVLGALGIAGMCAQCGVKRLALQRLDGVKNKNQKQSYKMGPAYGISGRTFRMRALHVKLISVEIKFIASAAAYYCSAVLSSREAVCRLRK